MAEFDDARGGYNKARAAATTARTQLIRAAEEARRLEREAAALAREANRGSGEAAAARLREVEHRAAAARAGVERGRGRLAAADAALAEALGRFARFTDPTEEISRLPDDTPIALFPLRLETRYRTVLGGRLPRQLLLVRVYPDDALVDSFQPEVSEAELANVTTYWTHRWRAGGDAAGHRAAWAALVRSHGAGRAKWLIDRYAPLDPALEPVAAPGDHLLVVRPSVPVPAAEQPAIATFWERMWSSGGSEHAAARADLENALGPVRADEVEADLVPVNFLDVAVRPGESLSPRVVFLDLPDPSTLPVSAEDWTRGARTWLLPERLVLVGFSDGQEVLRQVGAPIPAELQIGPDPAAGDDEQIRAEGEDLEVPEGMRWTVDFDTAVQQGMAFVVDLTERAVGPEFDRLLVLGVRLGSDAAEGAAEVTELVARHQASRRGFALLPQGRPTNNTDAERAGYSWWVDPGESFAHFFEQDPADDPDDWRTRKDGAWLAGLLGVDREVLRAAPHYYGTDQAEARAMNMALWPGTLGYYMEQMMEPVFSPATVAATRDFFNRFVIGRGTLPLVRIGRQPYGVLPATAWSRMAWWESEEYAELARARGLPGPDYLGGLFRLVERAVVLWRSLSGRVSHVGDPGEDAHQTLLDIVGLHPTSAEFYQRYSQSFTQYYNALGFALEPVSEPLTAIASGYIRTGLLALAELGWTLSEGDELPGMLERVFLKTPNLLKGELVAAELSETAPLPVERADGLNYIGWLWEAARTSHDMLRKQEGFADGVPTALLYLMLRHALDLGYVDTGLELRREALGLDEAAARAERREPQFLHVAAEGGGASRWQALYRPEPAVTGDPALRLGDHIPKILSTRNPYLATQLAALGVLEGASTAALERALVEHVDCLSYRLDAWRMGLHAVQLAHLRRESADGFGRDGLYVGAYGWLEDLKPRAETLTPVDLAPELAAIFESDDEPPLMRDEANRGHIHAPSPDHAVTAAILRNGHFVNSTDEEAQLLAVDLSSERVRWAIQAIQGIRNGQSLAALLGYRLERALHDEDDLFLDRLIYDLRRAFPLAGNRNRWTRVEDLDRITRVEARNVLDGVAFADHLEATGELNYPYGLSGLPPLSEFTGPGLPSAAEIGALIDGHVADMRSIGDAVGDLAIAEGVYQVVRGNYERAAGTLDAFSKGAFPPEPEVVATPRSGKTLTHRIGLHLAGGLAPGDAANTTPRAKGEPALARWLAGQLPDPAAVFARVAWHDQATDAEVSLTPSMADLGLAPVDLFYLVDAGGARDMPGFDDLLIDHAVRNGVPAPRDDATFALEYKPAGVAGLTLFEVAPLIRALRGLVLGARPLRPTDLALPNEAGRSEDAGIVVRRDKAEAVRAELDGVRPAIQTFLATLEAAVGEGVAPEAARDAARDSIDQWMSDYATILRAVAPFGLRAASLTTAIEGRRERFTALHRALGERVERWEAKETEHVAVMAEYAALPPSAGDAERIALLVRAARIVSTTVSPDPPATITQLENDVAAFHGTFVTALGDLRNLHDGAERLGATLVAVTDFAPTIAGIDAEPFDLAPFRDGVLALARDLMTKTAFLRDDVDRRLDRAADALARSHAAVGEKAQAAAVEAAQALLGEAFLLLPEFFLAQARLAEWENAWSGRAGLLDHLQSGPEATPFPVEDWLHGVARVRERVRHLELVGLLGPALGAADEPALEALQFPHRPDDAWLGMRFPETLPSGDPFVPDEDKLLYSAHFGPGAEIVPAQPGRTYGGLLLDEWVEVIPTGEEGTGLAFHFDRPNSEAPQAILLATPPILRGAWQWQDLVDALLETLDFARLRAVEPAQLETSTALPTLVPAVVSAVTLLPLTAMLNFALNNNLHLALMETDGQ